VPLVYIVNPEMKSKMSTQIKEIFYRSGAEKRIFHSLKKGGVFDVETLVVRAVTNALITLPQIGNTTVKFIINRLIKERYIFDVTDKSYQEERYRIKNEINDHQCEEEVKFAKKIEKEVPF
jgi:predicted transcriptional regulator